MRLVTTPGILLRSHPYSESSRILRFLTPDFGVVALIGKGIARRGASSGGLPDTFGEGLLTFSHRPDRELHTLRDFHKTTGATSLGRDLRRFLGASLLVELLLAHALQEGDPPLYAWIRSVLIHLGTAPESELAGWILAGGWRTLSLLGFAPDLDHCAGCGKDLGGADDGLFDRFDAAAGGLRCPGCSEGSPLPRVGKTARRDLATFVRGAPPSALQGSRAHLALLEDFALHHLAPGRTFRSVAMLRPLLDPATVGE
ncbi:MAG: DNA repair protein RecO [Gemmatimonadota bacterium]